MKKIIVIVALLAVASCKKNDLASELDCSNAKVAYEMKEYRDILKKFKINLPKNWKTQMYYDDFQSQISSADTTKSINDTYILELSWHQGDLELNDAFAERVKDTLALTEKLAVVTSKFFDFQERPSYYSISEGTKGSYQIKNLQLYIKTEPDAYFTITTKVYGNENVEQRLCEAFNIFQFVAIY